MIELLIFSACYEKLKTGYYSTSVYQDVRLKYFDSIFSIRIIWLDSGTDPWSRIVNNVQWWSMINKTKWKSLLMLKFSFWLTIASLCSNKAYNIYDENAVAVTHSNHIGPCVVGHNPFRYSSTFKKFIFLPNNTLRVLVTGWKEA